MSLHEGEVPVDEALVRALLAEQASALAARTLQRLDSTGTVDHVFRLGRDLLVRLPRLPGEDTRREAAVLALVAPALPVAVPQVVHRGAPGRGYPFGWLVVRWIDGAVPVPGEVPREDLADAVLALRRMPVVGLSAAGPVRGDPRGPPAAEPRRA